MVIGPLAAVALLASASLVEPPAVPDAPAAHGLPLEGQEAEAALRRARVVSRKPIGEGITSSERLVLEDGGRTLRAAWKTIDVFQPGNTRFQDGTVEVDFRDSWRFEVAAYELDKLLGIGLVPPVVERTIDGRKGSLQMWVEGAMTDAERRRRGLEDPDADHWNRQIYNCRLLHQLTYNTDYRNVKNVLVDSSFRVYVIDFSRAFRTLPYLMAEDDLDRVSRSVFERLSRLDAAAVEGHASPWIRGRQVSTLLKRRDRIVAHVRRLVAEKGEAAGFLP
jgi:hypothetical protein